MPRRFIAGHLLTATTVHLSVIVVAATALSMRLHRHLLQPFFLGLSRPWLASAAALVALVTGFAALVTLASSAALRYDPSLQFLQLLSALDIAWAAAAFGYGMRRITGSARIGIASALMMDAVCVFSIWNYLRIVGFGPGGAWLVDGSELLRWVLPFDVVAALMALVVLWVASDCSDKEVPSPA